MVALVSHHPAVLLPDYKKVENKNHKFFLNRKLELKWCGRRTLFGGMGLALRFGVSWSETDILDVLKACDPFATFAFDEDLRTADEGLDGGLSLFCGFAGSLPLGKTSEFSLNASAGNWTFINLLSGVMPVPAMLDGRGFLGPADRRWTPEFVVDVDIALPGLDVPTGVTSPDRDPIYQKHYLQQSKIYRFD